MSPHIILNDDIDEVARPTCPEHYEALVLKHITGFMQSEQITIDEFNHYCHRLNAAIERRPRSAQ